MRADGEMVLRVSQNQNLYVYRRIPRKRNWYMCCLRRHPEIGRERLLMLRAPCNFDHSNCHILLNQQYCLRLERNFYKGIAVCGPANEMLFTTDLVMEVATTTLNNGGMVQDIEVSKILQLCMSNERATDCIMRMSNGKNVLVQCVPLFGTTTDNTVVAIAWSTGAVENLAAVSRMQGQKSVAVIDQERNITIVNTDWIMQRHLAVELICTSDEGTFTTQPVSPFQIEAVRNLDIIQPLLKMPPDAALGQTINGMLRPEISHYVLEVLADQAMWATPLFVTYRDMTFHISVRQIQVQTPLRIVNLVLVFTKVTQGVEEYMRKLRADD